MLIAPQIDGGEDENVNKQRRGEERGDHSRPRLHLGVQPHLRRGRGGPLAVKRSSKWPTGVSLRKGDAVTDGGD